MEIKMETFEAHTASTAIVGEYYAKRINGMVDVIVNKKIMRVYAQQGENWFFVFGFCGKYRTGTKVWSASVTLNQDKKTVSAWFGRDERSSNCYKQSGIFYAPETFFAS